MEAREEEITKEAKTKKPDESIQQLLEREDILQELRNQNKEIEKLLHYENYRRLIGFIVRPGPPENQHLSLKYPFLVSDILCLELKDFSESLFTGEPLIKELLSFLEGEGNYILASYFSKVMNSLLKRMHKPGVKYNEEFCQWLLQKNYLGMFVHHLYSRSIVEPILRILTLKSKNNQYMTEKTQFLISLAKKLGDPQQSEEFLQNIALIFQSLINNDFSQKINYDLAKITYSRQIISTILSGIGQSSSVRKYKCKVVTTYFKQFRILTTDRDSDQQLKQIVDEFIKNKQCLEVLGNYCQSLLEFLSDCAEAESKAGLQLIAILQTLQNFVLFTTVSQTYAVTVSKHLPSLYKLLSVNCWNNILHTLIVRITGHLRSIFKGSPSDMITFLDTMVGILLTFSHIFEQGKGKTAGYVGYILQVSEMVLTLVSTYKFQKSEEWNNYQTSLYKLLTQISQLQVGEYKIKPHYLPIVFERQTIREMFKDFLSHQPKIEYHESKAQKQHDYEELKIRKIEELVEKESTPVDIAKFQIEEEFEPYKYWKETSRLRYDLEELMDDI